jgi:hypothetical protein
MIVYGEGRRILGNLMVRVGFEKWIATSLEWGQEMFRIREQRIRKGFFLL